jgi:hypothetical protein
MRAVITRHEFRWRGQQTLTSASNLAEDLTALGEG